MMISRKFWQSGRMLNSLSIDDLDN